MSALWLLVVVLLHYTYFVFLGLGHCIGLHFSQSELHFELHCQTVPHLIKFFSSFVFLYVFDYQLWLLPATYTNIGECNIYNRLCKPIMFFFHFLCNYSFVMTLNIEIEKKLFCVGFIIQVDWSGREKDSHFYLLVTFDSHLFGRGREGPLIGFFLWWICSCC